MKVCLTDSCLQQINLFDFDQLVTRVIPIFDGTELPALDQSPDLVARDAEMLSRLADREIF
jgi:hypothetical protein